MGEVGRRRAAWQGLGDRRDPLRFLLDTFGLRRTHSSCAATGRWAPAIRPWQQPAESRPSPRPRGCIGGGRNTSGPGDAGEVGDLWWCAVVSDFPVNSM